MIDSPYPSSLPPSLPPSLSSYATDETEELMPLTHLLATSIGARLTEVRKKGVLDWVRPDGKTQVTVEVKQ